ncbi:MAG: permease prefix domain 1-containing protein [Planctomycetota bacterium]
MAEFRELIEQATRRLSRDRELRLEVSRELESHLEASAAEFLGADYSEEDAHAAAVQAFGPPEEVAEQLWEANRFRLKWRARAWWLARLTLLPACVLATLIFAVSGISTVSRSSQIWDGVDYSYNPVMRWQERRLKGRMTAEQRLIYFGDESADSRTDRWRAVRDANPQEVLDQLELISMMLSELPDTERAPEAFAAGRQDLLVELERGSDLDPDNGVYSLITAGLWLLPIADDFDHNAVDATVVIETLRFKGGQLERTESKVYRWPDGADEQALSLALTALEEAASKPYLTMHVSDRVRRRLAQLPAPRSMHEYLGRISREVGTLLPSLSYFRTAFRLVSAAALRRAESGDQEGALYLLKQLDTVSAKLAASAEPLISLLVAHSCEHLQRVAEVAVWRALGDEAEAAEALARSDSLAVVYANYRQGDSAEAREFDEYLMQTSGALMSTLIPAVPGYRVDTSAFRKAEYATVDRAALTVGLLVIVVLSSLISLSGGYQSWRNRRSGNGPLLLWIGWRRLGLALAGGVGLPLMGFMVWVWTPWSGRAYGLNYTLTPLAAYLPLCLFAGLLLWLLGRSALRQRAYELGLSVPTPPSRWPALILAGLILGVSFTVWGVFRWSADDGGDVSSGWALASLIATAAALGFAFWWLVRELIWLKGIEKPRRALGRAALVGLAVALGLGLVLRAWVGFVTYGAVRTELTLWVQIIAAVSGVGISLLFLAGTPGRFKVFAASIGRSISPILAMSGLLLALTVGTGLSLRERSLAKEMVALSPVFFDLEIKNSNAREFKAYLAGEETRPPRRP